MLTASQVAAFRLSRNHFTDTRPVSPAAIAHDVCGVQAQVLSAAYLQLWARNHSLTRADIDSALWTSRSLVKSSAMRGTLHLLAADDLPMYFGALRSSRLRAIRRVSARYGGVTPEVSDAVMRAVSDALRSGPATRAELTEHILSLNFLTKRARKWFKLSWWGVVRQAIVEGLVCYGPDRGQQSTFIRLDQWLPNYKALSEPLGKRRFLRRYLAAYGPAAPRDFARWAGMSVTEAKLIWDSLQRKLVELSIEGRKAWLLREDLNHLSKSNLREPVLSLLPNFDPYLLAHADKSHLVDRPFYSRVFRTASWISCVVLLNGKAIGTWALSSRGKSSFLEVRLFSKPTKLIRALIEAESSALSRYLDSSLRLSLR